MLNEFWGRSAGETRRFCERPPFRGHAPDATVRFVAIGMPEACLVMPDDWIVPVANVERPVGTELYIDGTKVPRSRFDERFTINQSEARTIVLYFKNPNGIVDVAAGNNQALPVLGKMSSDRKMGPRSPPWAASAPASPPLA